MLSKCLRRVRNLSKRKKKEEEAQQDEGLKCPGCHKRMGPNYPIKRYRQSTSLDHYLCQCGTVSHWIFTMVMVCIGYDRYRYSPGYSDSQILNRFEPHRLTRDDLLWITPDTNIAYLFDRGYLSLWKMNQLPFVHKGEYTFSILPEGRVIEIDNTTYRFNGFFFAPYRWEPETTHRSLVVYRSHHQAYTLVPTLEKRK